MIKNIYLTIDDSPSIHMDKKVSFLSQNNISALFYARGEFINKHPDQIINAIKNGFLIGNHSYSHPYFSQIPLETCFDEILKTERLIDACYETAQVKRPVKVVRLPFADRGAGPKAMLGVTPDEIEKVSEIQAFLRAHHFVSLPFHEGKDDSVDAYWDWDTEDYKSKHIADADLYLQKLQGFFDQYTKNTAVLLLHDFDHNHHLFETTIRYLLSQKVTFLEVA